MYEEEQLANQKMVFDDTVKVVKGVINLAEQVDNRFGTKKEKSKKNTPSEEPANSNQAFNIDMPFEFTGQHTDLSYFLNYNSMPIKAINDIEDTKLRKAVNFVINDAVKDGYVKIEDDVITITDEGKKHISTTEFQEQIQPNIDNFKKRKNKTEIQKFEWIGSDNDLLFFKDNESLDLTYILGDKACVGNFRKTVNHQFYDYIENGIINISRKGVVSLTDKGKKLMESLSVNDIATKNVPKIILNVVAKKTGGKSL